jgi:hypothetical protein
LKILGTEIWTAVSPTPVFCEKTIKKVQEMSIKNPVHFPEWLVSETQRKCWGSLIAILSHLQLRVQWKMNAKGCNKNEDVSLSYSQHTQSRKHVIDGLSAT